MTRIHKDITGPRIITRFRRRKESLEGNVIERGDSALRANRPGGPLGGGRQAHLSTPRLRLDVQERAFGSETKILLTIFHSPSILSIDM